jgi:hypothetical protein
MAVIIADQALREAIAGLKVKVEVRDASGDLLGWFTPRQVEEDILYQYADEVFDPEETRRRLAEPSKGFTFEAGDGAPQVVRKVLNPLVLRYRAPTAFPPSVLPIPYKKCCVRMKIMPSDIAGVAMHGSPMRLTASSSNLGPARTTRTSPSSLVK